MELRKWRVYATKPGASDLPLGRRSLTRWGAGRERERVGRLIGWVGLRMGIWLEVRRDG